MVGKLKRKRSGTAKEEQVLLDNNEANAPNGPPNHHNVPSGSELRVIKDAADLFVSQSFKLQVDALLPNVRPKLSNAAPLERFLFELHAFLKAIPPIPPEHPLQASRRLLKKGIAVPYCSPLPTEDTNWKVSFEPPSDIFLVGSWANKVSVKAKDGIRFGVDLSVEMPASLFQEKDYLNGRFFHKKAFYLATVAEAVKCSRTGPNFAVDAFYDCTAGDTRLTTLVICPVKGGSNDFSKLHAHVRIILTSPASSPIPIHRLSPSHSNIRTSVSTDGTTITRDSPTPLYNTALLISFAPKRDLLELHSLQQNVTGFDDALTLLRVWANQRGYGSGARCCIRGFEGRSPWWSAILKLLLVGQEQPGNSVKRKPLGRGLSSYQLFKAALNFLATHHFENEPVFLKPQDGVRVAFHEYVEQFEVTFTDTSTCVNLLAGVPLCSVEMLRYDAKKSLDHLDHTTTQDPFSELFLKDKRGLFTRFDTVIRVHLSTSKELQHNFHAVVDWGSPAAALLASLGSILRRGLGDRAVALAILHPTSEPRPISQAHPSTPSFVHIGIIYDQEHAFRLVDHGPSADESNRDSAAHFRNLWGEKAELRRFKDGRIEESVVWDVVTADDRTQIPARIVYHLLGRHFGIAESATSNFQEQFDSVLRLPKSISRHFQVTSIPTGFKAAHSAFDGLVKALKLLGDDLPLTIVNVSACSEYLRYTSVFVPVAATTVIGYIPLIEAVLEFEKSAKWPDDLRAIQHMKLAFFERIGALLMSSISGLKASVVIGDGVCNSQIQDQARLEILTPQGWGFSIRLWHDREIALLDQIINKKSRIVPQQPLVNRKEYQHAVDALENLTRRSIHAPRHHRVIASLCHRYPAFSGTVRLVKRWLASHWLLHGHVGEEAVEIICASAFVSTRSEMTPVVGSPGSKERGFATVVELLKDWTWQDGMFIPIYGHPDDNSAGEIAEFKKSGSTPGVWRLSTEADKEGFMWTSRGPDIVTANRIQALAQATWDCLGEMEDGTLDIKTLFTHSTDDYDFILYLNPASILRSHQNINAAPDSLVRTTAEGAQTRPGFDPVEMFIRDLQNVYADTLRFFYDPFGGNGIGAVWEPSLRDPSSFKTLGRFSSVPQPADGGKIKDVVVLNKPAIIGEIERMGKGLVKEIKLN